MKRAILAASLALAGVAQAAEITIYKQPNFAGGDQTFARDMTSLQGTGVYDQSKSIVVRSGQWQACSQPNFQGDCLVLGRGQYPTLPGQLAGRIESIREVSQVADAEDRYARWRWEGGGWRERANFVRRDDDRYDGGKRYADREGYGGGSGGYDRGGYDRGRGALVLFAEGNSTRYDRDGAERLVIREGRWEICVQPDYRGMCRVYEPGVYNNLGRFSNQIGSIRRVG
jgi:hypothetical protein